MNFKEYMKFNLILSTLKRFLLQYYYLNYFIIT